MDHTGRLAVAIFVLGTATASFVTGLTGFAFLVAAAIWLYALTPPDINGVYSNHLVCAQQARFGGPSVLAVWIENFVGISSVSLGKVTCLRL
jgi:hypothetical protein